MCNTINRRKFVIPNLTPVEQYLRSVFLLYEISVIFHKICKGGCELETSVSINSNITF